MKDEPAARKQLVRFGVHSVEFRNEANEDMLGNEISLPPKLGLAWHHNATTFVVQYTTRVR